MNNFRNLATTYKECLLPIIPPGAKLSPQSTLHPNTLGKIPGLYNKRTNYWTGFPRWSEHVTTSQDIAEWDEWPNVNIGINLRNHVAIDIDVDDVELIDHIVQILEDRLPATVIRERQGSPRVMYFYYCPNNTLPAVQRVVFEGKGMVEILAKGRQAILEGVHPSGRIQTLRGNLNQIQEEDVNVALDAIFYAFPEAGKRISHPQHKGKPGVWREIGQRSYRTIVETITLWRPLSGRHDALRDLIWGMLKDGRKPENTTIDAQAIMRSVPIDNRDGTWIQYFETIPRLVEGARDKQEFEKVDFSEHKEETPVMADFPHPVGRLGELTDYVMRASPHPNLIVSTATALGLTAGIVGRRFNAVGVGLNLYISLLMPSGMGKDIINKFISRTLISMFPLQNSHMFLGHQRYTGAKALLDFLQKRRCCVSVFTEAGLMFSTKLGDVSGLQRALLDLFTKSGSDDYTLAEGYSSSDNDIKSMRAPCFTMINESTPDAFIKAMKKRDAEITGELARMLLFNVGGRKARLNPEVEYALDQDLKDTLCNLIDFCGVTQEEEDPQAVHLIFEDSDRLLELNHHFTDRYNGLIDRDPFRAIMYSRSWIKAIKLSALSAVLDYSGDDYSQCVVGGKHLDWALSVLEFEMQVLGLYMKANEESPIDAVVKQVVIPKLARLFHDPNLPVRVKITQKMRDDQVFSWNSLVIMCKNNRVLEAISDASRGSNNPKTGLKKALNYMLTEHLVVSVEDPALYGLRKDTKLYRCAPTLQALIG